MARMANAFLALMTMAAIVEVGICADHIIGAPGGSWDLQTNFSKWASSQKFLAGDNLIFVYGSTHSVLEVTKGDYDTCTTTNPLSSDNSGNTSIALTASGTRYFICGTPMHCSSGMKIAIRISSPSSPPPVLSPPAPTSPSSVSSPPPVASPPPPQKSAASAYDLRVQIAVAFGLGLAVLMLVAL
ncbi:uclacyanin 1-like [Ananas comosus]|uniref:Uclacyanin 1-like n=1 Tax=Ananas comosus TaxID=4615 RepID=A0A6P5FX20_ANACO|nr:uclacyanin 1-like [Ananas comosus]